MNLIDASVVAKLVENWLIPAPPACKETLVRRAGKIRRPASPAKLGKQGNRDFG